MHLVCWGLGACQLPTSKVIMRPHHGHSTGAPCQPASHALQYGHLLCTVQCAASGLKWELGLSCLILSCQGRRQGGGHWAMATLGRQRRPFQLFSALQLRKLNVVGGRLRAPLEHLRAPKGALPTTKSTFGKSLKGLFRSESQAPLLRRKLPPIVPPIVRI